MRTIAVCFVLILFAQPAVAPERAYAATPKGGVDIFIPSEEVSADLAVAFPVDI